MVLNIPKTSTNPILLDQLFGLFYINYKGLNIVLKGLICRKYFILMAWHDFRIQTVTTVLF